MLLNELLANLKAMFVHRSNRITNRKSFKSRVWKKNKPFGDYLHDKIILANRVLMDNSELIDYIIEEYSHVEVSFFIFRIDHLPVPCINVSKWFIGSLQMHFQALIEFFLLYENFLPKAVPFLQFSSVIQDVLHPGD